MQWFAQAQFAGYYAAVDEGNPASYTIALSGTLQSGETASINLSLSDVSTDSDDLFRGTRYLNEPQSGRFGFVLQTKDCRTRAACVEISMLSAS